MPTIDPASFLNPAPAPKKPSAPNSPAAAPPKKKAAQPAIVSPGNFLPPPPVAAANPVPAATQSQRRPGWLALWSGVILTAIYVLFELRYNRGLLDMMIHGNLSQATIDAFTQEGKILAAIGLSWVLVRPLVMRIQGVLGKFIMFVVAAGALYWGLHQGYDYLMRNLSPDTKLAGVQLTAYREMLLTKQARYPGIAVPVDAGKPEDVLAMTAFPLLMTDTAVRQAAQDALEKRIANQGRDYSAQVAKGWPQYQVRNKTMMQAYAQYLSGSREAEKHGIRPGVETIAQLRFSQASGGMKPNSKATYQEFVTQLSQSSLPPAREMAASENRVLFTRNAGSKNEQIIRNRDIPLGMTQAAYHQHFTRLLSQVKAESVPTRANIATYPKVLEANSALFIPMLAMLVSLASIIVNAGLILWLTIKNLTGKLGGMRKLGTVCVTGFFVVVLLAMPRSAFTSHAPLARAEALMQRELGLAGQVMSRLMSVQKILYANTAALARTIKTN